MLDRPEFEDLGRMRELFKTFEEKGRLVKILNACISGHGVRVIIGHENPEPAMQDLTLVTAACPSEAEPAWALGVLGSTRMEYARVVTLVDRIAREVSETLSELSA
jgi:heat-inducible transcriptional repressor